MNNKIVYISETDMMPILEQFSCTPAIYVVEVDGKTIKTPFDYYSFIEEKFRFPYPCKMNVDSYLDWIRDLSWLDNYEEFAIVVHSSLEFLSDDITERSMILRDFENIVFPWWENDVEKFCVGGRKKRFNIYMIE